MTIYDQIESALDLMTDLEREIACYFMGQPISKDALASTIVTKQLHISQAALTRFAKKCGFKGYREFVFEYLKSHETISQQLYGLQNDNTKKVFVNYQEMVSKSADIIDEEQLLEVSHMIEQADRVYFYGKGSSSLVAKEFKIRLMRLGVICEALDDTDSFSWTNSIVNDRCLVIAFSLSGNTNSVIGALKIASCHGAKTVLFTKQPHTIDYAFDKIIQVASARHLDYGNRISPQIPMLIMVDIIYAQFLDINKIEKERIFRETIIQR
ncbi:TPA: MurR/RpiR family transcriptional regulator [Streptococcus agalactiae]|nr:MurR/RpiR family transcriptional regulator [Streptococcus agalactiae]HEO6630317.1 MurR/RpiR family transcriptional regulator [Streptococcus agalactiae]HEO6657645.1 MurR/RpiR family transcriptional regulator [Streptococcus agalactiae]